MWDKLHEERIVITEAVLVSGSWRSAPSYLLWITGRGKAANEISQTPLSESLGWSPAHGPWEASGGGRLQDRWKGGEPYLPRTTSPPQLMAAQKQQQAGKFRLLGFCSGKWLAASHLRAPVEAAATAAMGISRPGALLPGHLSAGRSRGVRGARLPSRRRGATQLIQGHPLQLLATSAPQ